MEPLAELGISAAVIYGAVTASTIMITNKLRQMRGKRREEAARKFASNHSWIAVRNKNGKWFLSCEVDGVQCSKCRSLLEGKYFKNEKAAIKYATHKYHKVTED